MKFIHLFRCDMPKMASKYLLRIVKPDLFGINEAEKRKWLMRINLIIVIMTSFLLQVSASSFAQHLTIKESNATLKQVFTEIRKQTGYTVLYESDLIEKTSPVNLNLNNVPLETALRQILADQNLAYEIKKKAIIITQKQSSVLDRIIARFQDIDVKGKLVDENGQPSAGASISIKGTDRKTTTNDKGEFSMVNVDEKATLLISYIGYEIREIPVKADLGVIKMAVSTGKLEEVVVSTGYQTLSKERSTGSFAHLDNVLLNKQVGTNILTRLEAITNGVVIDRGTSRTGRITVRGLSTIQGPKEALVIVDDFPYNGDLNNINPNDVEDITILKDAAASSIWGASAGNGVIVIKTKKGRYNQPFSIDFNSNIVVGDSPNLSYLKPISSSDFIDVEQMLYAKGFFTNQINSSQRPVLSPVVELLINRENASESAKALIDRQIGVLRKVDVRDQFDKYMYQKSLNQQYAINLRGGTNSTGWLVSGGLDKNIGYLNEKYQRINLGTQYQINPAKNLRFVFGLNYTQSKSNSGRQGLNEITSKSDSYLYPYAQFADENSNAVAMPKNWRQSYIETAGNGKLQDWSYYPLEDYKHTQLSTKLTDLVAKVGLNYQILNSLSADVKYQYERQDVGNNNLYDSGSYFARNLTNGFAQISPTGMVNYILPKGGILDVANGNIESNNIRLQLNFNKKWDNHELVSIAGWESRTADNNQNRNRFYGYNENISTHGLVNYTTQYPNFITGSNMYIVDHDDVSSTNINYISYFANSAYTFKDRYTLSASARRDASNLFGLYTNDQWNPFWSTGISWNLSKETFYKSNILPYLRLRATYGSSGNINPAMVASTTIFYAGTNPYTSTSFAQIRNYYNPELKWETSKMVNFGLDFKSGNDIVTGSIEYFRKKGENLFGAALVDYTGISVPSLTKNIAGMKGEGWDIEIKSNNIQKTIKWSTTLNMSFYKDEITDYYLSSTQGSSFIGTTSNVGVSGLVGKPVYSIFSYRFAGLDPQTGDPRGYLNNEISKDYAGLTGSNTSITDLAYNGSAIPTKYGSLINTVSYKGLSVNFSILYKFGYYFRKSSINYNNLFNNWTGHSDFETRWQKPGDEVTTNVPSMVYPTTTRRENFYAGSEANVEKGDHIRLQYISLSYDLPKQLISTMHLRNIQVYFNTNNVGLLWKANKSGIDPDYNYGTNVLTAPRTYAIGIKVNL
ncbi:MAG: SusC/RagA family TonB-linked outer membrane protein [Chryseobacterium sp.]|nr:MAG: SusC/RagA family TonB-linked outer membrane protein [Chryseobacterium sp.]